MLTMTAASILPQSRRHLLTLSSGVGKLLTFTGVINEGVAMQIADAEWRVMDVLWKSAPLTAVEIAAELASEVDWSSATVKTLLHRLVKKGAINFVQEGKRYSYRPAVQRKACMREVTRSLVDRVFGGEPLSLVEYFVRSTRLSPEDLRRLRRLVDEQEGKS